MPRPTSTAASVHPPVRSSISRYGLAALFPALMTGCAAAAAASSGLTSGLWAAGAVLAAGATGVVAVRKERAISNAKHLAADAVAVAADKLYRVGEPIVAALADLTVATTRQDRLAALTCLQAHVAESAYRPCERAPAANFRAVFYALHNGQLERRRSAGRHSNVPPRRTFDTHRGPHDAAAIRLAHSEEVLVIQDLLTDAPADFQDPRGRSYRSLMAVPVRAGNTSYGLLTLDSDQPGTLTDVDKSRLILLANLLAAGLAHDRAMARLDARSVV